MPEFVVEKIIGQREWAPADDPTRKTVFYEFTAEGVEKVCSIGRKPDNPLKVGDRFEATSTEDRGKLKLKRVQGGGWGGGGQKDYKADPAKLRGEAMRSAIHAACSYATGMAKAGTLPTGFTYQKLDPMIQHFYGLIVEAQK